jgi:hypothetical protein
MHAEAVASCLEITEKISAKKRKILQKEGSVPGRRSTARRRKGGAQAVAEPNSAACRAQGNRRETHSHPGICKFSRTKPADVLDLGEFKQWGLVLA